MDPIKLPDEYKDKGWAASITDDQGNIDIARVCAKIEGQEHLLGKKVLPGKMPPKKSGKILPKK